MKRIGLCLLLLAVVAQPALAGANRVFFGGGIGLPAGPEEFTDYWKLGFTGHGSVGLGLNNSMMARFGVDYSRFGVDEDAFVDVVDIDGGTASIVYASGGLQLNLTPEAEGSQFYFTGGVGLFHVKVDDATASTGPISVGASGGDENAFGLHFGAGATFSNFFAEVVFVLGLTEGESTSILPIRVGAAIPFGRE